MAWSVNGRSIELCNCEMFCPCWLGPEKEPDKGWCAGAFVWEIGSGESNGVDLGGNDNHATGGGPRVLRILPGAQLRLVDPEMRLELLALEPELRHVLHDALLGDAVEPVALLDVGPKILGLKAEHRAVARDSALQRFHRIGRVLDVPLQEAKNVQLLRKALLGAVRRPLADDRDLLELGRHHLPLAGRVDPESVGLVLVRPSQLEGTRFEGVGDKGEQREREY